MKNKNFGFTLAEVLITLAIIGVVAAMTIPTLVNKYQDRVNETRYKKAVSMLSQAVQLSMAQADSPGNMTHTDLWACKDKDDFEDVDKCFTTETKKLFKNVVIEREALFDKMEAIEYGNSGNIWGNGDFGDLMYLFTTGDGITFGYFTDGDGLKVLVDTNGASKPNNVSKDLYALQIQPNGKVADVTASLAGGGSGSGCGNMPDKQGNMDERMQFVEWVNCTGNMSECSGYYSHDSHGGGTCGMYQVDAGVCTYIGCT